MKNMLKGIALVLLAVLTLVLPGSAQTYLTYTTLAAAIADSSTTRIVLTSATGVTAGTSNLFINLELMGVTAVNGTTISVTRGSGGTRANPHATSSRVYITQPGSVVGVDPVGPCTKGSGLASFQPVINQFNGNIWHCQSGIWTGTNFQPITYNSVWVH